MRTPKSLLIFLALCALRSAHGACPYASGSSGGSVDTHFVGARKLLSADAALADDEATSGIDYAAVKADIAALLTDSKEFWPADFGRRSMTRGRSSVHPWRHKQQRDRDGA